MDLQLLRIDDRLIHGQVVIGWASKLNTREIVLCDDSVVENEWEKELYLACVPGPIAPRIMNVSDTAAYLKNDGNDLRRTILLVESPYVIEDLLDQGVPVEEVNVGGMHFKDQRRKFLPYLYMNDEEIEVFNRCMNRDVRFICLDVPNGKKIALERLL
jgi:PTS system mannose-specific IIB component